MNVVLPPCLSAVTINIVLSKGLLAWLVKWVNIFSIKGNGLKILLRPSLNVNINEGSALWAWE